MLIDYKGIQIRFVETNDAKFVVSFRNNEIFATYGVYKIGSGLPETGSMVSKPEYVKDSIKVDVAVKKNNPMSINEFIKNFHVQMENTDIVIGPETAYSPENDRDSLTAMVIKVMMEDEYCVC
ncbi:hypothetical protein [Chryseobacterium phocaeense]|uniref:hypothetical protein n=1 Tax=Chryseobacterium phocaeense TaxID=1816690 RepID=UPI0009BACBB8|nr:hypothetical protein [Chryseobacterium phocaeense]